jgi:hypothetical protein
MIISDMESYNLNKQIDEKAISETEDAVADFLSGNKEEEQPSTLSRN